MKKKSRNYFSKIPKVLIVFVMIFTTINFQGIKNSKALSLEYQAMSASVVSAEISNIWGKGHSAYKLKMGGEFGFCLDLGKSFKGGNYYDRSTWSGLGSSSTMVRKAMNWYYSGESGDAKDIRYWTAQIVIWGVMEGKITDPYDDFLDVFDELVKVFKAVYGEELPSSTAQSIGEACRDISQSSTDGDFYLYSYTAGYQRIATNAKGYKPEAALRKTEATKSYSVTEQIQLNINKTDEDTNNGLSDTEFDFYRDSIKIATVKTNIQGKASYTYKKTHTQSATSSATYCENYNQLSPANKDLVGAVDFTSQSSAQAEADKQALSKAKDLVQALLNEEHEYKAIETKTKTEYYLNGDNNSITKDYASNDGMGSITFSMTNKRQLATINLTKMDSETSNKVDTAIYGLYANKPIVHPDGHTGVLFNAGDLVATFPATDTNGNSQLTNQYLGSYYIEEITAPYGYLKSKEKYYITLSYAGQNVQVVDNSTTVNDKVQRASLEFQKDDRELVGGKDKNIFDNNNDGAQGDATRVGAVYGLYAEDPIVHADGSTDVVTYNQTKNSINEIKLTKGTDLSVKNVKATANTLLATAKTDKNGQIQFEHLYNGKYYVKEIEPSEGYLLDTTIYHFDLRYTNQNETVIKKTGQVLETVKKQAFEILKVGHVSGSSMVVPPLKDVEFTVKLESDVQRLGWDNAPIYDVLITDKDGRDTSIELPFGLYHVKETKSAHDYDTCDDFYVTIDEDSRTPQSFSNKVIVDEAFSALIKAVKKDSETGKQVALPNTKFKIKALTDVTVDGKKFSAGEYIGYWNWNILDGFYTDTWKTNEDGYVIINEKLSAGEYQLEEINAPYGYILDTTPVKFRVTNSVMIETGKDDRTPIITVYKEDAPVKGQINLTKMGEVLTDYRDGKFIYEERGLPNAEYNVLAKEPIYDPANDGTILFNAGEVVDTIKTNADGKGTSKKLPLGIYELEETKAPYGMVLNKEKKTVILEYEDENTEVVFDNATYINERQKIEIIVSKQDTDTNEFINGMEATLYANRDIYNYDGEVIVKAGSKLESVVTEKDGKAIFTLDLPLDITPEFAVMPLSDVYDDDNEFSQMIIDGVKLIGNPNSLYVVKETKNPNGYEPIAINYYVQPTYTTQDESTLKFMTNFYNDKTEVEISKVDKTTGKQLPNAHLQVIDPLTKKVVAETITTNETWVIRGLTWGKEYILREEIAPNGYLKSNEIKFTVGKDVKVVMEDEPFINVEKLDKDTNEFIADTELVIIDAQTKEVVKEITTKNKAEMITGLIVGKEYIIKEVNPSKGYYLNEEEMKFIAEAGMTVQFYNNPILTDIQVNKVDDKTLKPITSFPFEFTMYADKECTIVLDVAYSDTNTGTATFKKVRPNQTVYIKETKAPKGYKLSPEVKEIVLDDNLEGFGDIHSFIYKNSLLPVTIINNQAVETKDSTLMIENIILALSAMALIVIARKKRKED